MNMDSSFDDYDRSLPSSSSPEEEEEETTTTTNVRVVLLPPHPQTSGTVAPTRSPSEEKDSQLSRPSLLLEELLLELVSSDHHHGDDDDDDDEDNGKNDGDRPRLEEEEEKGVSRSSGRGGGGGGGGGVFLKPNHHSTLTSSSSYSPGRRRRRIRIRRSPTRVARHILAVIKKCPSLASERFPLVRCCSSSSSHHHQGRQNHILLRTLPPSPQQHHLHRSRNRYAPLKNQAEEEMEEEDILRLEPLWFVSSGSFELDDGDGDGDEEEEEEDMTTAALTTSPDLHLELVRTVYEANPDAIRPNPITGLSPLYHACQMPRAADSVLIFLIERCPDACSAPNHLAGNRIPMHCLLEQELEQDDEEEEQQQQEGNAPFVQEQGLHYRLYRNRRRRRHQTTTTATPLPSSALSSLHDVLRAYRKWAPRSSRIEGPGTRTPLDLALIRNPLDLSLIPLLLPDDPSVPELILKFRSLAGEPIQSAGAGVMATHLSKWTTSLWLETRHLTSPAIATFLTTVASNNRHLVTFKLVVGERFASDAAVVDALSFLLRHHPSLASFTLDFSWYASSSSSLSSSSSSLWSSSSSSLLCSMPSPGTPSSSASCERGHGNSLGRQGHATAGRARSMGLWNAISRGYRFNCSGNLVEFRLSGFEGLFPDMGDSDLASPNVPLRRIVVDRNTHIPLEVASSLANLIRGLRHLETVVMEGCLDLDEEGLYAILDAVAGSPCVSTFVADLLESRCRGMDRVAPLCDKLRRNTVLRELTIRYYDGAEDFEEELLRRVLRYDNCSLINVGISRFDSSLVPPELAYLCLLNQFGRSRMRLPTTTPQDLLSLILRVKTADLKTEPSSSRREQQQQQQQQQHNDCHHYDHPERLSLLYDLLREAPHLWCHRHAAVWSAQRVVGDYDDDDSRSATAITTHAAVAATTMTKTKKRPVGMASPVPLASSSSSLSLSSSLLPSQRQEQQPNINGGGALFVERNNHDRIKYDEEGDGFHHHDKRGRL